MAFHRCAWAAPLLLALLAPIGSVEAQDYPNRPVTLIVPYGPGGNADLAARSLAATAKKYLKGTLIVENRVGAGGIIGSRAVADAPKDGYTMLLARVGSQAVAPALDPATTYTWDGFTIIGLLEIEPYVCVVNAKSPIRSVSDLIRTIKNRPGALSYATTGNFDASAVFPIKMLLSAGLDAAAAAKIPYKSTPETITALLSEQTDFACNGLAPYLGSLRAGTLRAFVVSTRERVTELPSVQTVGEAGMPELQFVSGWSALYGPPNLPSAIVDRWTDILMRLKDDPEWSSQPKARGALPNIIGAEETRRFVEAQYRAYKALAPQLSAR